MTDVSLAVLLAHGQGGKCNTRFKISERSARKENMKNVLLGFSRTAQCAKLGIGLTNRTHMPEFVSSCVLEFWTLDAPVQTADRRAN